MIHTVDAKKAQILQEVRAKYPEAPDPGSKEWGDFLKELKESDPDTYRKALLLGGAVTAALEKEIRRSKARDARKALWDRLFFRPHSQGKVPDKKKIGLILFLVVGGLFSLAFFLNTAPKKEGEGLGAEKVVAGKILSGKGNGEGGEDIPTVEAQTEAKESALGGKGTEEKNQNGAQESGQGLGNLLAQSAQNGENANGSEGNSLGAGGANGANAGGQGVPTLPPPPPPVYGAYGTTPPPPDPTLAQGYGAGTGTGTLAPPMVLYADTGLPSTPNGQVEVQQGAPSNPQPSSSPPPSGGAATGGMLFLNLPTSSMGVYGGSGGAPMGIYGGQGGQVNENQPEPVPQAGPLTPTPPNGSGMGTFYYVPANPPGPQSPQGNP